MRSVVRGTAQELDFTVTDTGVLLYQLPRIYHYLIFAVLVVAVFLLDVGTPLGVAVWLLYVIPIGYALRYLRQGRITFSTLSSATGGMTVLILLGWFFSPRGWIPILHYSIA